LCLLAKENIPIILKKDIFRAYTTLYYQQIGVFFRTRCENYYVLFKNRRKSIKLQIKSDYALYVKSVEDSLTSDPKKF
ncbi:hypothetical protein BDFB_013546, partial [Asbolus verrucosus]